MSSLCNVKKTTSVSELFSDFNSNKIADNIYYEEAWDLRMARLGIDISELNSIFPEDIPVNPIECENDHMTRSCIDRMEPRDPAIPQTNSSAIKNIVLANNPVYSFKSCDNNSKTVTGSPGNKASMQSLADGEHILDHSIDNLVHLHPKLTDGILLNNVCYEYSRSQLVNAIIDKDSEYPNSRRLSNIVSSAFKPLTTLKCRYGQPANISNNHGHSTASTSKFLESVTPTVNFNRQVSAPTDSATEMLKKMTFSDVEKNSKTLQSKPSRPSKKKPHNFTNSGNTSMNTSTIMSRVPIDQHLHESSRISNTLMSKSMVSVDECRLSDNYIKHLTGQEIAGNFIKQSQRPECHIQRIDDHYHCDYSDSRLDMIADQNRPLEEHLWYHPFLSRVAAEQLLAKYPEGSFLVRRSESCTNEYSLSIRYKQKWLHMKISRDIDGQFVLGQYSQPYPSIPIMIRHYSCSFLPVKGANLISLQQPVFRY